MSNFRVHHGLQDFADVPDLATALDMVKGLLELGLTNVLITKPGVTVTGHSDYDDIPDDGRVLTLVLEIPVGPGYPKETDTYFSQNERDNGITPT